MVQLALRSEPCFSWPHSPPRLVAAAGRFKPGAACWHCAAVFFHGRSAHLLRPAASAYLLWCLAATVFPAGHPAHPGAIAVTVVALDADGLWGIFIFLAMQIAGTAALIWGAIIEPSQLQTTKLEIRTDRLAPGTYPNSPAPYKRLAH